MATAVVNTAYLATYTGFPEPSIHSLLDAPTPHLVTSFLQQLIVKAQDHDRLKAERLRLDVELENAIRGGEAKMRAVKANADKALQDVEALQTKLKEEESACASLASQLDSLQANSVTSSTEVQALQDNVGRLEQSNRDTLALLDAKSTSHDKLAEELSAQHQKTVALRREVSALEERKQTVENNLNGARFRESSLQQEIELLKRNNEWFESELKTKSSEYTKYRKEKSTKITELQRLNEDANATMNSMKRTESSLRKRLDELGSKAEAAFTRIQSMQEDAARADESFRAELDNARRLADLHKQSVDTTRRRVQELDQLLDQTREDAAEEISQVQSELETERQGREAVERRVEELENELERLATEAAEQPSQALVPATPRRNANGLNVSNTPIRAGSPAFSTPSSTRNRGGLSMTQMYSDYTNIKTELDSERRRNEKLTQTIDEMIQDLEKKEPELQELQMEHAKLEAEVAQLSSLLVTAGQEKEVSRKESRKFEGRAAGLQRETGLLRQQLRDHSVQIKVLLVELQSRQDGSQLTAAERGELEQVARAELSDTALDGMSDTGRFISQRLTTFKSIFELQERNAQLLHLTRQLGEQMEGEEAKVKQDQQEQDHIELENLRERVERYKDEVKSLVTQSQSYIRERDMFRRMVAHRGHLPPGDLQANFGNSINGPTTPRTPPRSTLASGEESEMTKQLADYAKLIKELQSHFDAYRHESATDLATYKTQVFQLAKEKADLQGEIARAGSQVTLAHERYEMLQANYQLLKTENAEHQNRAQSHAEIAAKQDIRTQQVAEELVDARGLAESMRNDIANLKAEKEMWKKIESRLREDNQSLAEEKAKLNKVVTDTQNLANERELSDSETRRKLQNQVEGLESEMRVVKRKLDEELDESKKNSMRREYEQEQSRKRVDDLVTSLSNVKEELAAAKATRDQYQARIEELKIDLHNAEEREQVLRPRPTPRADPTTNAEAPADEDEVTISHEQELGIEVADLKKELQLAHGSLEAARAQVEQYKAISQSSEEELQSLNESQDQYHEETERIIAEKESKVQELEQRVEDILTELNTTNTQLSELRDSAEDTAMRLNQQQATFETEVGKIREESEKYMEMAKFHQEDLKAQAEIAQQAQQSYENELLKHAEAAKALHKVRADFNKIKLELSQANADAESARTTLSQSEESWQSTRERYELELTEIKSRRHEIDAQNKILHQQLESVGSQITSLQQNRASVNVQNEMTANSDSSIHNLQEVIKYLRREKEIIDVQYELSMQEAKRLRQQLDYSQSQLDDTRLKLDQERHRQTDQERSSISHSKLMETINELNVFRESSVTLRNEARQAQKQLAEKTTQVDELIEQIQPLETSIREMENEREISQGELKLLQEDRDRWQQRTQNILQKYDRVDPAEMEALRGQVATLQQERDDANVQTQSLQGRVDQIPAEIQKALDDKIPEEVQKALEEKAKDYEERRQKMVEQFKGRSRELSQKINTSNAEHKAVREELEKAKAELEAATTARDEALSRAQEAEMRATQAESVKPSNADPKSDDVEDGQVEEGEETGAKTDADKLLFDAQARAKTAEETLKQESARTAQLQQELTSLQGKVTELESQVVVLQDMLDQRTSELSALQSQAPPPEPSSSSNEILEQLKQDLAKAQKEVETLRTSNDAMATATSNANEGSIIDPAQVSQLVATQVDLIKQNLSVIQEEKIKAEVDRLTVIQDEKIKAEVDRLTVAQEEKIKAEVDRFNLRAEKMKQQLTAKLADARVKAREEVAAEHDAALQNLRSEHEAALEKLTATHESAISDLQTVQAKELEKAQSSFSFAATAAIAKPEPVAIPPPSGPASSVAQPPADSVSPLAGIDLAALTLPEVQSIVAVNQNARDLIRRNITGRLEQQDAKLKQEREELLAQKTREQEKALTQKVEELTTEHEKALKQRLDEAMLGFQKSKEQAVVLEGKKWSVKFSMTENKARQAMAKVEVFRKAAEETPQKPVFEVWAIVKDMKVPPPAAAPQAPAVAESPAAQATPAVVNRQPSISQQSTSTPKAAPPTPVLHQSAMPSTSNAPVVQVPVANHPGPPTPASATASVQAQPDDAGAAAQRNGNTAGRPSQQQGTGPATLRNMMTQNSAIPRGGGIPRPPGRSANPNLPPVPPAGINIRGGGNQHGGEVGRGRGRGAGQGNSHSPGGSPGGQGRGQGPMNPVARQFIPGGGNKRPREGSDGGVDGLAGKRARGDGN